MSDKPSNSDIGWVFDRLNANEPIKSNKPPIIPVTDLFIIILIILNQHIIVTLCNLSSVAHFPVRDNLQRVINRSLKDAAVFPFQRFLTGLKPQLIGFARLSLILLRQSLKLDT